MIFTRYHHFIPTKEEEEKGAFTGHFPLYPIRSEFVDVTNESHVLLDLFDPWEFRKVLTFNDVGNLGGLVLSRDYVQVNWPLDWKAINRGEQAPITIQDVETRSDYNLYFRKWINDDNFIIHNNWIRDFVYRRDLKEGDTIGMYWNRKSSLLCFAVLRRVGMK